MILNVFTENPAVYKVADECSGKKVWRERMDAEPKSEEGGDNAVEADKIGQVDKPKCHFLHSLQFLVRSASKTSVLLSLYHKFPEVTRGNDGRAWQLEINIGFWLFVLPCGF